MSDTKKYNRQRSRSHRTTKISVSNAKVSPPFGIIKKKVTFDPPHYPTIAHRKLRSTRRHAGLVYDWEIGVNLNAVTLAYKPPVRSSWSANRCEVNVRPHREVIRDRPRAATAAPHGHELPSGQTGQLPSRSNPRRRLATRVAARHITH